MEKKTKTALLSAILFVVLMVDSTFCDRGEGKVIGVFDDPDISEMFFAVMATNLSTFRNEVFVIAEDKETSLTEYLCSQADITFIYAILSISPSLNINILSSIATARNIPVFVYDVTLDSDHIDPVRRAQGGLLYYMNSQQGDEGLAISDMVLTYNFAQIDVIVQSKYQYDGFRSTLNDLYIKYDDGELVDIVFSENETINDLLIQLQSVILSKEDKHYISSEVVILHCDPDIGHQLLKGAELLFHDKQIIWILSLKASGDVEQLRMLNSDIISLSTLPVDYHFIADSLTLIAAKLELYKEQLNNSMSCDQTETNNNKTLLWRRLMDESMLTVNGKFYYYRYNMNIKAHRNVKWSQIGQIDSSTSHPVPSLLEYLQMTVKKLQMLTVATVFDQPFSVEASSVRFDGGDYCPTPSVPCLKIDQTVIENHDYSSDIIKKIFDDYYADRHNKNRPYTKTCCEGLCVDLLKSLSSELQFDYQLYIVPDGEWGAFDTDKGNWSGLVKELLDGRADMVVASFSITSARSAVIGYSAPFYHSGFSLMAINKKDMDTKWFSYLDPYPMAAWAMILAAACITFLILGLFEWWSPRGLNSFSLNKKTPSYTLGTAIKTVFSLMSGNTVPTKSPLSWPGKWIQNVWGFFSIIYLSAYTANLTSSIADSMSVHSFTNINDVKLLELEVAAPTNGAIEQYVKLIRPPLYERIKRHKIKTIAEGIDHLRDGTLDVWMHDTPVIDYVITRENSDCALKKVLTFAVDSYGIGFPSEGLTDIKDSINSKVLQYQMAGYMERLHEIYFTSTKECQNPITDGEQIELKLNNAAGMFLTLMAFVVICFLLTGLEHLVYRFVIPYGKRQQPGSLWRGKSLMFFSQRMHRAIEKDGAHGSSVFKEFMKKFRHLKQLCTIEQFIQKRNAAKMILKLSFKRKDDGKMNFYEVVAQVYERKKKKPLSSIFHMKEKTRRKKTQVRHGLREMMSLMTVVPFAGSPSMVRSLESLAPTANEGAASRESNCRERDIELTRHPTLRRLHMDDSTSLQSSFCSTQTETTFMSESLDIPGEHSLEGQPAQDPWGNGPRTRQI